MKEYKTLITTIAKNLKAFGYRKYGNSFICLKENNYAIIDFQKSKSSKANYIKFTINLGVYSSELEKFNPEILTSKLKIYKCHWQKRIGFLLPINQDYWWIIDNNTNFLFFTNEILSLVKNIAIPELENHVTDSNLIKDWMNGIAEGVTKMEMYVYLITLLKAYNYIELPSKFEELKKLTKGKPIEDSVKDSLAKIGINYE